MNRPVDEQWASVVPPDDYSPTAFLDVRDLRIHFPTDDGLVKSVDGLSFTLERGRTLGIVGESGSGKSVTSLGILGLHKGRHARISGQVWLDGDELVGASPEHVRRLRGKKMAMIFQDPLSACTPSTRSAGRSSRRTGSTTTSARRRPASTRSTCWAGWGSRSRSAGSTPTPTSSPAGCGSGR